MFSKIKAAIQEFFKVIKSKDINQVLNVKSAISSELANAIELWELMYRGRAPWLHEPTYDNPVKIVGLGLPAIIAAEKARTATMEMKSNITDPRYNEEDKPRTNTRADFLSNAYGDLLKNIRRELEVGVALGGLIIKPYYDNTRENIVFSFCYADSFYPIAFDSSKNLIEVAFTERKTVGKTVYTRLEWHKRDGDKVIIRNSAYENTLGSNTATLGAPISLTAVPEWADYKTETTITGCNRLLFTYFKMPEANTVDPYSPIGVSGFSRATALIREADKIYSELLWEFEAGQIAIDVDRNALSYERDNNGRDITRLSTLQQRLYRKVDLNSDDTYHPFAPTLRDASIINGLNETLMRIEDACFLSRGTLSNTTQEARTATELKILKQRSYQANKDLQDALRDALEDVLCVLDLECDLYKLAPHGDYEVSFEFDDSILVDTAAELDQRLILVDRGVESRIALRMWYFGETELQAKEAIRKIDNENDEDDDSDPFIKAEASIDNDKALNM